MPPDFPRFRDEVETGTPRRPLIASGFSRRAMGGRGRAGGGSFAAPIEYTASDTLTLDESSDPLTLDESADTLTTD